ncbi:MAG: hypothetical protein HFF84_14000 [Oscillibacter sp.]|nr:hypothetical protein [Oscillibacter sp.]
MYEGRRAQSPFDDSAADRLRRMGLADEKGALDRDALSVCSCIFSGQFFDDLCDYFESYEDVRELISGLSESAEDAAGKQKFLLVCLQYDAIYRTLPDPVWWISGNPAAAELFAEGFIARLKQLDQDK